MINGFRLNKERKVADFEKGVREYLDLGHTEPVPVSDLMKEPTQSCYMPMYGVVMESLNIGWCLIHQLPLLLVFLLMICFLLGLHCILI